MILVIDLTQDGDMGSQKSAPEEKKNRTQVSGTNYYSGKLGGESSFPVKIGLLSYFSPVPSAELFYLGSTT